MEADNILELQEFPGFNRALLNTELLNIQTAINRLKAYRDVHGRKDTMIQQGLKTVRKCLKTARDTFNSYVAQTYPIDTKGFKNLRIPYVIALYNLFGWDKGDPQSKRLAREALKALLIVRNGFAEAFQVRSQMIADRAIKSSHGFASLFHHWRTPPKLEQDEMLDRAILREVAEYLDLDKLKQGNEQQPSLDELIQQYLQEHTYQGSAPPRSVSPPPF